MSNGTQSNGVIIYDVPSGVTHLPYEPEAEQIVYPVIRGEKGERGEPGADAVSETIAPIFFSWGDATPVTISTLVQRSIIQEITVIFRTAFDGANAAFKIGIPGDDEALMSETQNAPAVASQFTTTPGLDLPATTPILLTLFPGAGATQGSGVILISFTPIP